MCLYEMGPQPRCGYTTYRGVISQVRKLYFVSTNYIAAIRAEEYQRVNCAQNDFLYRPRRMK